MSGGGCSISLGDYNEEWRAQRRLVHSALQRCCQQSLHDVIERQALHLRKVQMTGGTDCTSADNMVPYLKTIIACNEIAEIQTANRMLYECMNVFQKIPRWLFTV